MPITGYATSRFRISAWPQLMAQMLTRHFKRCILRMLAHNLLCYVNNTSALIGLSPSDVTLRLDTV